MIPRVIISIIVNLDFKELFNDLVSNFARFSLEEFTRLKSNYSKTMFRLIKQYRTTGHLEIKISDFYKLLDIPKSYRTDILNFRVLKSIKLELAPLFRGFAYQKLRSKKQGRKIITYKFTWEPEAKNKNDFQDVEGHYQEQLENIDQNQFLKAKEKKASTKLIKAYYYKNKKRLARFVKQKEKPAKIEAGKKLYKTSNQKAKKALGDFKKKNKPINELIILFVLTFFLRFWEAFYL